MSDLIDRRQAIKAIDDLPNCYNGFSDTYDKTYIIGVLEELPPAATRWHRVEDELPDLLQFVVVCNDEGKCVVAQYVGYQTGSMTPWRIAYSMYDTDAYIEAYEGPVCYWMPIEPPGEDA